MTDIKNTVENTKDTAVRKAYELKGEAKGRLKQMQIDAQERSANEE